VSEALTTLNLVKYYVNICNAALSRYKQSPAFIDLRKRFGFITTITLIVMDERGVSTGFYTTRFVDDEFTPVVEGAQPDADASMTLRTGFLNNVMNHADEYIKHPEKLDWSWLDSRSANS
jgi:hypothetical protein